MSSELVSHYQLGPELGSGALGQAYEAYDTKIGSKVVIKFLSASISSNPHLRDKFLVQIKLASTVVHPNIASVYEIWRDCRG